MILQMKVKTKFWKIGTVHLLKVNKGAVDKFSFSLIFHLEK